MKVLVLSDCHVHAWQEFSVDDRGVPSRLRDCLSVWRRARKYAVKHGITNAVFGGDLHHKRGILYTQTYNLVVAELALWKKAGISLYANVGNHDQVDKSGEVHAISALASAGLLVTTNADGWANWTIRQKNWDDVSITAVAYCSDASELRRRTDKALESREDSCPTLGVFHHGFKGARVGTSLEYQVKEDANADEYSKSFSMMLSGHYHQHQRIGSNGNAFYVGSPMEFVRGETGPKGFAVVDMEGKPSFHSVELRLPRFVKLTDEQLVDDDFDVEDHVKGNFVDVVYEELPAPWSEVESELLRVGARGAKACPTRSKASKSARMEVDPTKGDKALLETYLEHAGVDPGERADLLKVGLELLEGAAR